MQKLLYRLASGEALWFDFGMGFLIAMLLKNVFGLDMWWPLAVLVGIVGGIYAFFPDFDVAHRLWRGEKIADDHHQSFLHTPFYLLGLTIVTLLVLGLLWTGFGGDRATALFVMAVACCSLVWHYLHDTRMLGGGGIALLAPLFKRPCSPLGWEERIPLDETHESLVRNWLRPSRYSFIEIPFGCVALGLGIWLATHDGNAAISVPAIFYVGGVIAMITQQVFGDPVPVGRYELFA